MKILVLTDRFVPEVTAPSVRIMDHARCWLASGHEVTVVTCVPNIPRGVVFDGYENKLYQEETIDGVQVIRVWSFMTANEGTVKRSLDYVSFMLSATLQSFRFPEFDAILATSPPLFTAVAGWAISRLRRRPWVFEVRDLWPASIKAVGAGDGRMLRSLERLELFLYRQADRIVSLTHSFKKDMTERGIPAEKNDVVINGVDTSRFNVESARFDARSELGIPHDVFLAGYVGTTGMAHGLGTVLEAAEFCKDEPIHFLIMGDGAERKDLEADARRRDLRNVTFHDFVPHDLMPSYLRVLDASIVHLRPDPLFRTVIPSKIFEVMAMGRPVLMGVEGESADIIAASDSGVCFPSGDAVAMGEAARMLAENPERCAELGRNGMKAAQTTYGREPLAQAVISSLERAVESYRGGDGT